MELKLLKMKGKMEAIDKLEKEKNKNKKKKK